MTRAELDTAYEAAFDRLTGNSEAEALAAVDEIEALDEIYRAMEEPANEQ